MVNANKKSVVVRVVLVEAPMNWHMKLLHKGIWPIENRSNVAEKQGMTVKYYFL